MTLSDTLMKQAGWRPPSLAPDAMPEALSTVDVSSTVEAAKKTGFDQGYAEGIAAGRIRGQQLAQALEELLKAMATPFAESDPALVKELLELTRRVATAVIDRELESDQGSIQKALIGALDVLGDIRYEIELRVNPDDAALCRQYGGLAQDSLVILEDPHMRRGGLELKSGSSLIDASVEARLAQVMSQLYAEAGVPEPEVVANMDMRGAATSDVTGDVVGDDAGNDTGDAHISEQPAPVEGELLIADQESAVDTQSFDADDVDTEELNDSRKPD